MKSLAALLFFSLTVFAAAQTPEAKQPLVVQTPANWEVTYKGDNGVQFYSVIRKEVEPALLMFSRWPAPGNKDQIPSLIDTLANGFINEMKKHEEIKLESLDYKKEKIEGDSYSGEFALFTVQNGMVQTMFMISDGDGIWNGQFTGSKERWAEALDILKKLKKNG